MTTGVGQEPAPAVFHQRRVAQPYLYFIGNGGLVRHAQSGGVR